MRLVIPLFGFVVLVVGLFGSWYYLFDFYAWSTGHWLMLGGMLKNIMFNQTPVPPVAMGYSALSSMVVSLLVMMILSAVGKRVGAKTVYGGFDQKSLHGTARFANKKDIHKCGLDADSGVVLGRYHNKRLVHNGPEHVLVFAPTRSGKGVSVVMPTLFEWQHSAIVLDIKGELHEKSSGYRASQGQRILLFQPASIDSMCFNPLSEVRLGSSEAISDVQRLANILVDPNSTKGDKYFAQEGYDWLSAVIMHVLVRAHKHGEATPSFADVAAFMSAREFVDYDDGNDGMFKALCQSMMEFDHGDEAIDNLVHNKAAYMKSMADKQRSGVVSTAMLPMQVFQDPMVDKNTSRSDFTIDSLMMGDAPSTLYLYVKPPDIPRLKPLIKMLMEIIIMKHAGRDLSIKPKQRLMLLMDEFTSVGKLEIFETAIAFIAGYGMKFVGIIQDFNQLHSVYGKEESIFSNCHVRLAFAPNRIETAKTLSDMTGKTTVIQHKRGTSGEGLGKSVSDSANEVARNLMTPEEIMSMRGIEKGKTPEKDRPGQTLIFVAGQPPILAEQALFYQDKVLVEREAIPAPAIEASTIELATPTATKLATPTATKLATPTATKLATPTATKLATPTATKLATPTANESIAA